MKWKIRDVEIANQVVLAPMAGICNMCLSKNHKRDGLWF